VIERMIFAVLLGVAGPIVAQEAALKPGVTIYLYDIGESLDALPTLVAGQTPNVSFDSDVLGLAGAQQGLGSNFFGEAHGYLVVASPARKELRLRSSGGAELRLGDFVLDADRGGGQPIVGTLELAAGRHPFTIRFRHGAGEFALELAWRDAGVGEFAPLGDALQTEQGITHVVAPGLKRYVAKGAALDHPGDGRPLEGVHPGYTLEAIRPAGFEPRVGALALRDDGALVVCTWDETGVVWILEHPSDPKRRRLHRFADGLGEPLGCAIVDGVIHVSQKREITRLVDTDGDGIADEYIAVAHGWPASSNYHEFTFNLLYRAPHFFVATSVPLKTGDTMYVVGSDGGYPVSNGPGSMLRVDAGSGAQEVIATGLRTPNGLCENEAGDLFVADNQGSWLPASRLNHVVEGGFYGHQEHPTGTREAKPPVVWFPQNEIGNSPAQGVFLKEGPYAGHLLIGDVTHGGLKRVVMEKVAGEYQGAVFRHSQGLEAGVNRVVLANDGSLYVGGIGSNGNWNWNGTKFGLQRLAPNGQTAFEIHTVRARADGFEIDFTRAIPLDVLRDTAHYSIEQWRYAPTAEYGGSKVDTEKLAVRAASVAPDRQRVFLEVPGLKEGRVVHLRMLRIVDDRGSRMWTTEAWYTLNRIPAAPGPSFEPLAADSRRATDPPPQEAGPAMPVDLFTKWPIETWRKVGEATFALADGVLEGSGTLKRNSFLVSPEMIGDFAFECDVLLEDQRNSGIQIRSHVNSEGRVYGYQIEIDGSDRSWSGGLYDEGRRGWLQSLADNEAARAAFKRGDWNHYRIECRGPRIRSFVNGVPCTDFEDTADLSGHLMFQVHSGDATTVKWRNCRIETF
jgi:glucose/arabinose dehydrogenase